MGQARRRGTREQRIAALLKENGVVQMTPERYNAFVAWTRSPIASYVGEELEFFSDENEKLIGVIIQDYQDRDYVFVVLGRDAKQRFRCIDIKINLSSKTEARHSLFDAINKNLATGEAAFPQGDEQDDKAGIDLFKTKIPLKKQHSAFQALSTAPSWSPARGIMSEMMNHFVDVDNNFVQQFQTTGFDSRIWELYLYAAFLELGLFVNKEHEAPDFEVTDGRRKVFIEAVTVGPSPHDSPLPPSASGVPTVRSPEEVKELVKTRAPIRFGGTLRSKLNRNNTSYWDLEHVKGNPLVFAIADFHEPQAMTWSAPALVEYLYGISHEAVFNEQGKLVINPVAIESHEYKGKKIPSGFFEQPDTENVSAILFSSSGTISKFNRMGALAGFDLSDQQMIRIGLKHCHDPNSALPTGFVQEVKQGVMTETWAEGLSMYHNPKAKFSVDPDLFPGIAHHWYQDGQLKSLLPKFHVYNSFTWHLVPAGDDVAVENPS